MTQATSRARPPASWYPDPAGRHEFRYWSGDTWTEFVVDGPLRTPSIDRVDQPGPTSAPGFTPDGFTPDGLTPYGPTSDGPIPGIAASVATATRTTTPIADPHEGMVRIGQATWVPSTRPETAPDEPAENGKDRKNTKDRDEEEDEDDDPRSRRRLRWLAVAAAVVVLAVVGGVVLLGGAKAGGATVETLGTRLEQAGLGCTPLTLHGSQSGTCTIRSEPVTIDTYHSEAALTSARADDNDLACELATAGTPVRSVGVVNQGELWTVTVTSDAVARDVAGALGGVVWSIDSATAC